MSGPNLPNPSLLSAIDRLKVATAKLPRSTPEGSTDGIVWKNFNSSPHSNTGAIFEKIDQAYTRCFSRLPGSSVDPIDNILRGLYGMDVVIRFFEECARSPKLDSSASHLTEMKVGQLTDLVYARINSLPQDPPDTSPKKKRRHGSNGGKRKSTRTVRVSGAKGGGSGSSSGSDFSPQPTPPSSEPDESSSESDIDTIKTNNDSKSLESLKHTRKRHKTVDLADNVKDSTGAQSNVNATVNVIECTGKKRGRGPVVRNWALAHHETPVESFYPNTQRPAWAYKCKYCASVHHFPRTGKDISKEKISATNLAEHLKICENLPAQYKLDVVRGRLGWPTEAFTAAQASLSEMFKSAKPTSAPIAITPSVFRSTLIQGVVRDNYPLTFGEGKGMRQVFAMVSPGLNLPVHSTMRKDLSKLHGVLSERVQKVLNAQNSRFAITSDAWTSKSFVYSLGGVVVTFIDKSWNLQEFVLDIVHLDADHTGAGMGRKIFKSLDYMGAARSIIASVTDNASNNRTMNNELSTWLSKKYRYHLNVDHMSVICLCHALHLVCGAIFSNLKAMDPLDSDEQYAIVKSFEEGEIFEQSAEVLEEEEWLRSNENELDTFVMSMDASDEELEDLVLGNQADTPIGLSSQPPSPNLPSGELNCVQKVHCIVVDITSNAARRKRMRAIIRALGLELRAVIKSVKVRWNSILAEIRRAILLKAAINQYVSTLDDGKSGVSLRRARALKKKWTITDEEWDVLDEIVKILEPFESATRDYSRQGRTVLYSVLPTYVVLREKLFQSRVRLSTLSFGSSVFETLTEALKAGEEKLDKYFHLALKSDLTLLASVFHPGMRIRYFEDTQRWGNLGPQLVKRAYELLEYLYELYKLETVPGQLEVNPVPSAQMSTNNSGWIDGLLDLTDETENPTFPEEVRNYLDGKYRYKGGDILVWWKENEPHIPVLSRIARDILAIPATSVSVERLFSRCKLVMSDYRNMSVDTARQIITCQQWLEAGLGIDLPDFVSNDCNR